MHNDEAQIPQNAVSIYGQNDALDDFPVLKAFQQYVDAEQNKARKRMVALCAFFLALMIAVIGVFVVMLMVISERNQSLNDRLIEFAMKERDRGSSGSAVVVQPPPAQDSAAIIALTAKLDEMQKKLSESQAQAEKAAAVAAARAAEAEKAAAAARVREASKPKGPTAADLEIAKLKALLAAEKEKNSAELAKRREAELEAYRRKHYPELYQPKVGASGKPIPAKQPAVEEVAVDDDDDTSDAVDNRDLEEIDDILSDYKAARQKNEKKENRKPALENRKATPPSPPVARENEYSIPVEVKGSSSSWLIPTED